MRLAAITLTILSAAALLGGCNSGVSGEKPRATPAPATHAGTPNLEVTKTMETYFQEGLKRPFGPGGPRFELPASYYEYFASHMPDAPKFLDGKLASIQGVELANAYDIVVHMGQFASSREWALSRMKQAIDGGSPAKYMVKPAYDRLTNAETRP